MKVIWDWLTSPAAASDAVNPLSGVYVVVFLVGFVVTAWKLRGEALLVGGANPGDERALPCAQIGLWIFGAGLVFFLVRVLQIEPLMLGAPLWMVAAVVALIFAGWRCASMRRLD